MPAIPTAHVSDAAAGALDPDSRTISAWIDAAGRFVTSFVSGLDAAPAIGPDLPAVVATRLSKPPPEQGGRFGDLLETFGEAACYAYETAGPRHFAYVPGGGLVASAVAEMLARTVNRYTALAGIAPGLVAMEHGVLRWLCSEFGLPAGSGGLVTTGASMATLSVVVAARHDRLGPDFGTGTVYVTEYTNHCVAKAARIAGIRPDRVRIVPTTRDLRMDVAAALRMISADRAEGLRPFLIVGTAGSTDTGTVDPLVDLAALARREDLWLHVDAAYGGFFQLTRRGRERLVGIACADSITLDPHKGLFLPHGTGILLVRDPAQLRAAHIEDAHYLRDTHDPSALPNYADLGIELTREFRGLRLWLPLHLHGVAAFRAALDEKLDLALHAYDELRRTPGLHVPYAPELSTVVFRDIAGNSATQRLFDRIHASGRIFLSSTRIRGQALVRMCVLSHRSRVAHINDALEVIRWAARMASLVSSVTPAPAPFAVSTVDNAQPALR
ncbi:MAG TPA: aminotransferase class V-fold PLP-dependent enzyme [Actinophytocola sp.]|uniref:pyridoxal phosphate-dependent decarboxylase family protein n=1 Tax=Actinophytocola sp. TaxID=1872138 RepID=UPI002DBA6635|nr:aminotransferase class V-fold PLP-dependent enzyme [Actinophytocola sp.]HEU5474449.1 aminotransferase class V-fold PLP-dependent enzyme [Actinophytocola sp.]